GERGRHLKDEDRVDVALGVEREVPGGDLQRGGGFIEPWGEGSPAEISGDQDRTDRASRGVVIRSGQLELRLGGSRCARIDRPVDDSGRKSSHSSAGTQP